MLTSKIGNMYTTQCKSFVHIVKLWTETSECKTSTHQ